MMVQAQEEMSEDKEKVAEIPQPSDPTEHVTDEAVNEEMDDSLVPRNHGDTIDQTRSENVSKFSNDSLLAGVNTPKSARVESSKDEGLGEEDASKQGRITDIDANEYIYLVNVYNDDDMFGVNDIDGNEVMIQEPEQGTTTTTLTTITAASSRPKAKGLIIHEQEQAPTSTVSSQQPSQVKDKGKGKMDKPKPVKKLSKKDQLMLDEELAFKLQAEEEEEEERLAREKAQQVKEVNIAWDDVQAKIDADYELAQKLQAEEQEELTNAEKARLFVQFLEESSKKAEAEITQEGSSKRAGDKLEQERYKKQKVKDDKESEELKQCLEIIPDDGDDVTINATPLSSKSPIIVDYKIHKEGKKSYFQIFKADGVTTREISSNKLAVSV
uniref:Uncharacterized protein n=1 Tax=Tanacetum cinerariifolium TaxID=118510 RepID=A0A6L2NXC3_TANCI|nr:hypothetical protein [Tanacetum cinerariifolium]